MTNALVAARRQNQGVACFLCTRPCLCPYSAGAARNYVTTSLRQCVTTSLRHHVTTTMRHYVTRSLRHHVTMTMRHYVTTSPGHYVTTSLRQCVTTSLGHYVTTSLRHYSLYRQLKSACRLAVWTTAHTLLHRPVPALHHDPSWTRRCHSVSARHTAP